MTAACRVISCVSSITSDVIVTSLLATIICKKLINDQLQMTIQHNQSVHNALVQNMFSSCVCTRLKLMHKNMHNLMYKTCTILIYEIIYIRLTKIIV